MEKQTRNIFQIIKSILNSNHYQIVDVEDCLDELVLKIPAWKQYALYMSGEGTVQYVLLADIDYDLLSERQILSLQVEIYEALMRANDRFTPEFDKNVSLLLCMNADIKNQNVEKRVLLLEEDPYCFKKLVLTYTDEELDIFYENAAGNDAWSYVKFLVEELKEKDNNHIEDTIVKFVLKILIKLPFLKVDIVKETQKEDLMLEMKRELTPPYWRIWEMVEYEDEDEIKGWKNFDETQIDELIERLYEEVEE